MWPVPLDWKEPREPSVHKAHRVYRVYREPKDRPVLPVPRDQKALLVHKAYRVCPVPKAPKVQKAPRAQASICRARQRPLPIYHQPENPVTHGLWPTPGICGSGTQTRVNGPTQGRFHKAQPVLPVLRVQQGHKAQPVLRVLKAHRG